uniref:Uncharacterized protein n=1 Tax=Anopheles atroparvus TaxID=41427 RepID=A0A182IP44_ANOAO
MADTRLTLSRALRIRNAHRECHRDVDMEHGGKNERERRSENRHGRIAAVFENRVDAFSRAPSAVLKARAKNPADDSAPVTEPESDRRGATTSMVNIFHPAWRATKEKTLEQTEVLPSDDSEVALIQSRKKEVLAKTEGVPRVHPFPEPNEVMPICSVRPPSRIVSGPPESPLHAARPPSPDRHTFCGSTSTAFHRTMQSPLLSTGLLVNWRMVANVVVMSLVRPYPVTVPISPSNRRPSLRAGSRTGYTHSVKTIGERSRTTATSKRRSAAVYCGCSKTPLRPNRILCCVGSTTMRLCAPTITVPPPDLVFWSSITQWPAVRMKFTDSTDPPQSDVRLPNSLSTSAW